MSTSEYFTLPELPWNDEQALTGHQWAYCERIICIYDAHAVHGWWHDLENQEQLPFSEGGRIVESSVVDLSVCVEEAVEQGYRPFIFVDGMRNWPVALDALGRHRAFGKVYVFGRENEKMSCLLYQPSEAIFRVARDGGRISVPTLEYGKVLDSHLGVELIDFYATRIDLHDPLIPRIGLVCRLNPFRYIDVTFDCRSGIASLEQKYRRGDKEQDEDEHCGLPVFFLGRVLEFSLNNPLNGGDVGDASYALSKELTEKFDLPLAYRGWGPEGESPWQLLVSRLRSMSRGIVQRLTAAQQALLVLVDEAVLSEALPVRTRGGAGGAAPALADGGGKPEQSDDSVSRSKQPPFPVLVPLVDENSPRDETGIVFEVKWLGSAPPEESPVIVNSESGQIIGAEWSLDLRRVVLRGVELDREEIGWAWHAEYHRLEASFSPVDP
jgi:hypothetical protein